MKLWLLEPMVHWNPWFDTQAGLVVRAETEQDAREIAQESSGDEDRQFVKPWLDPEVTSCFELTAEGEAGIVLRSFDAA